jgi:hypothetical protein
MRGRIMIVTCAFFSISFRLRFLAAYAGQAEFTLPKIGAVTKTLKGVPYQGF